MAKGSNHHGGNDHGGNDHGGNDHGGNHHGGNHHGGIKKNTAPTVYSEELTYDENSTFSVSVRAYDPDKKEVLTYSFVDPTTQQATQTLTFGDVELAPQI